MAQRTVIELIDDLDNRPIEKGKGETVRFSLDNADYEIDLSKANADKLRGELSRFVEVARKTGGTGRRGRRRVVGPTREADQTKAIREWAKQQGMEVSDRGRIPARLEQAYNAAH
jgi:Lsr2